MPTNTRTLPAVIGLTLALLAPVATQPARAQESKQPLAPRAVAFVRTLAKGDFAAAEGNFTDQMKQAAPPEKLRQIWQSLLDRVGPFQDTGASKTVTQGGYTSVIVKTDFKSQALGIAVTFDSADRIAGMHFVPPP